jgi:hypothetical protein
MKRLQLAWGVVLVLAAMPAGAQTKAGPAVPNVVPPPPVPVVTPNTKATTEAVPYVSPGAKVQNEAGYCETEARAAVRRMAEARNEQRLRRLASMRWFGLSNSRPQASPDLVNGDYAPRWISNTLGAPSQWSGGTQSPTVIRTVEVQSY